MPPRYAYWTIIVDEQPTAFRSGSQEDLLPTFKRLKAKNDTAVMMWFQNGKLWPSRIDAQEAMRARGEMGKRGDERQQGFGSRDRESSTRASGRSRTPQPSHARPAASERNPSAKLDWKPKGQFIPAPKRADRPDWKPKSGDREARPSRSSKPEWKPKDAEKLEWKPKGSFDRARPSGADGRVARKPLVKSDRSLARSDRPEWKPKGDRPSVAPEKRKWVPKEEYKKSIGAEARRDKNWRPGGEHKDPRQKYKDAKKAKWSRFKQNIRARSAKGKKPS